MGQIKASDWVANFLQEHTDIVFGITGGVIINMIDSIHRSGLHFINTHNEQGAAIAADAYARLSGKLGVCVATSGPGALNLLQGIACSYFDSIPVLAITGQVVTNQLRKNNVRQFGFQETDICSIFKAVTKCQLQVTNAFDVVSMFKYAVQTAVEGRAGTAVVDFCDDIQRAVIENVKVKIDEDISHPFTNTMPIIDAIKLAKRPIIILGGGVISFGRDYREKAKQLIEKWKIPTALTWATLDVLDDKNPFNIRDFGVSSQRGANIAIQESDLLLVLGSRLDTHEAGSNYQTFAPNAKKIVIDIDPAELSKTKYDLTYQTFVQPVINALLEDETEFDFSEWCSKIQQIRNQFPICTDEYYQEVTGVNPYVFFTELSKVASKDVIIITDAGATLTWTMQSWKVKEGQRLITAYNHSPMGYALPASIGAAYAQPSKQVICIIGDGGLQMNIQELNLIAHHQLPIKIFVMNNHGYGIIKQTQDTWLESRYIASDGPFPDILKVARAYDLNTAQVSSLHDLNYLDYILSTDTPMLISVEIPRNTKIIPKLTFGRGIDNPEPTLSELELHKLKEFLHA